MLPQYACLMLAMPNNLRRRDIAFWYHRRMYYLATFLEGVVTFISPCLLPMLPLFVAYFAGGSNEDVACGRARLTAGFAARVGGFVLGFTAVFVALGATAGALGSLLSQYSAVVNVACGAVVVVFGLYYAGVFKSALLDRTVKPGLDVRPRAFASSLLFGVVFAVGWTPCVGVFLGSALALAAAGSSVLHGVILLLCYSAGLAIPFAISAFAIDRVAGAFDMVKRHYKAINAVCGALLVIMGLLMMTGQLESLLHMVA